MVADVRGSYPSTRNICGGRRQNGETLPLPFSLADDILLQTLFLCLKTIMHALYMTNQIIVWTVNLPLH